MFSSYAECQRCFDYTIIFIIGIIWLIIGFICFNDNPDYYKLYGPFFVGAGVFLICGIVNIAIMLCRHQNAERQTLLKVDNIPMYKV